MDEWEELDLVLQALRKLYGECSMWGKNYNTFRYRMDDLQRYRWWALAKKQAAAGAPAMVTLQLEVIKLRLTL